MTTLVTPAKPASSKQQAINIEERGEWIEPRRGLRWKLSNFFAQLSILASPFINSAIDAFTDRDIQRQTAAHSTAMVMDGIHAAIWNAYFFVYQPNHWKGERYHPAAVEQFKSMSKDQAREVLTQLDREHEQALWLLQQQTGVDLGMSKQWRNSNRENPPKQGL